MPQNEPPKENVPTITPEIRERLLKLFRAPLGEKPLNEQEFKSIVPFVDMSRGGLKHDVFDQTRGDNELVKAAKTSQFHKDEKIMNQNKDRVRETLLKGLQAKTGEKNLTVDEFKDVAIFLDRKNGGLRPAAFKLFKDDPQIVKAATAHRKSWDKDPSQPLPEKTLSQEKKTGPQLEQAAAARAAGTPPVPVSILQQRLAKRGITASAAEPSKGNEPEI